MFVNKLMLTNHDQMYLKNVLVYAEINIILDINSRYPNSVGIFFNAILTHYTEYIWLMLTEPYCKVLLFSL